MFIFIRIFFKFSSKIIYNCNLFCKIIINILLKLTEENKKEISEKIKSKHIEQLETRHVILDCSCMNFIDNQGVDAIILVIIIKLI